MFAPGKEKNIILSFRKKGEPFSVRFTADEGDFKHLQQSEAVPMFRKGYADVVGLGR